MPLSQDTAELPRRVFSPIAANYDRPAQVLGLFQYRRWHRFLLSRLDLPPGSLVLDVATGTGAMALDLLERPGVRVVGADITRGMLLTAQARADGRGLALPLVECTAEAPPFTDGSFDAITSGYLLRYVADVPATLAGLARLLKPGGMLATLDFAVPRGVWFPLWRVYTDVMLPAAGRLFSREWRDVGAFLGPNIRAFYQRWPEPRLLEAWRAAEFPDAQARRLSLGGGIVTWGHKAA
ncbi:MAG TPA: class I SAM-dependent methyltransferase [Dehalococcoidia bacterium]|nr:class I SAM-dependent methyltransferase [Dehalococcoidia bacterium]